MKNATRTLLAMIILAGCGDDGRVPTDASADTGAADSAATDGGTDGGPADSGPSMDALVPGGDSDGDGISNMDEGYDTDRDTDGDGTPDYLDSDSDDDGITDADEAGDTDPLTAPADSDGDGDADYIDLDSDDNGLSDEAEGTADLDGDMLGAWIDDDNDGDTLLDIDELGDAPTTPVDTDMDGTPDFEDVDSDGDTIGDAVELLADPDADSIPAFRDLDSDGDCVSDAAEAGDADLATPPVDTDMDGAADYLDTDADDDGLADGTEDADCDGMVGATETSPILADSDMDTFGDLVETVVGTDPLDPADNPDSVRAVPVVTPFGGMPSPLAPDVDMSTRVRRVDSYIVVDRSGSMSSEIAAIRANMGTVANNLTCAPLGTGDPATCIPEAWWGVGTVGYRGTNGAPYTNHLDLSPDPMLIAGALPTAEPAGCCAEPLLLGTYSAVTGADSTGDGSCTVTTPYPARTTCAGSPADMAGLGGTGYPCYRDGAFRVLLLATDEAPTATYDCPSTANVVAAANTARVKVIGILGSTGVTAVRTDLEALATGTGAVDAMGTPIVVDGANAMAAAAIEAGIRTLVTSTPFRMGIRLVDDPSDSVDAVAAFVDHIETAQLGTAECSDMLADEDTDADTFADTYTGVAPSVPVCWRLVAAPNTTVMATDMPQAYRLTMQVVSDDLVMDEREVTFIIPPAP